MENNGHMIIAVPFYYAVANAKKMVYPENITLFIQI